MKVYPFRLVVEVVDRREFVWLPDLVVASRSPDLDLVDRNVLEFFVLLQHVCRHSRFFSHSTARLWFRFDITAPAASCLIPQGTRFRFLFFILPRVVYVCWSVDLTGTV